MPDSIDNPVHDAQGNSLAVELPAEFVVDVDRMATGGAAIGSAPDGRITFVTGGLPGDRVLVGVTAEHKNRVEGRVLQIVEPAADRRDEPCPHVAQGCGGCDWQHATPEAQRTYRLAIVEDCLRRLGKFEAPDVRNGPALEASGYRTTVRVAVKHGQAGFRKRSSHDVLSPQSCLIAHPLIEELIVDGRFGEASEAVLRVGANSGERLVVVDPSTEGVSVPDDVKLVGTDELSAGVRPHYHEELGGLRLQISAASFFQCRPDGALALASAVGDALADTEGKMLDAYCGVGLFGALAGIGREVVGVESDAGAAADATYNLGSHATVTHSRFEDWDPTPVGVAVADPARSGLKERGCDKLVAAQPGAIALVSCDPASLARDGRLLVDRGYQLDYVTVFDLFGNTSHIETVARFVLI